jgi:hypothetical protein
MSDYACFNCDHVGGAMYKAHDGETTWFLGLTSDGQAHYACEDCKDQSLYNVRPVRSSGASADDAQRS